MEMSERTKFEVEILKIEELHSHMRQKCRNAKDNGHIASAIQPWSSSFATSTGRLMGITHSVDFASSKMTALSHGALEDSDSAHAEHGGDYIKIIKSATREQKKHVDLEGFDFHVLCEFVRICVALTILWHLAYRFARMKLSGLHVATKTH